MAIGHKDTKAQRFAKSDRTLIPWKNRAKQFFTSEHTERTKKNNKFFVLF